MPRSSTKQPRLTILKWGLKKQLHRSFRSRFESNAMSRWRKRHRVKVQQADEITRKYRLVLHAKYVLSLGSSRKKPIMDTFVLIRSPSSELAAYNQSFRSKSSVSLQMHADCVNGAILGERLLPLLSVSTSCPADIRSGRRLSSVIDWPIISNRSRCSRSNSSSSSQELSLWRHSSKVQKY
jgi:hypothetical protein